MEQMEINQDWEMLQDWHSNGLALLSMDRRFPHLSLFQSCNMSARLSILRVRFQSIPQVRTFKTHPVNSGNTERSPRKADFKLELAINNTSPTILPPPRVIYEPQSSTERQREVVKTARKLIQQYRALLDSLKDK